MLMEMKPNKTRLPRWMRRKSPSVRSKKRRRRSKLPKSAPKDKQLQLKHKRRRKKRMTMRARCQLTTCDRSYEIGQYIST